MIKSGRGKKFFFRWCVFVALFLFVLLQGRLDVYAAGLDDLLLVHPYRSSAIQGEASPKKVVHGKTVKKILVKGNERIEDGTIISYLGFQKGDQINDEVIAASLKKLYATQLFSNVSLSFNKGVLTVNVIENPLINRLVLEGNNNVKSDLLKKEITLKSGNVFDQANVVKDSNKILAIYRRQGYYNAKVTPQMIKLPDHRVNVIYKIQEGKVTEVEGIHFVGNKYFSEGDLEGVINTKENTWYRFLSSSPLYDEEKLNYDKELLRRFYQSHGFADFQVLSVSSELKEDLSGFIVTFHIHEGERYKIGQVNIVSDIPEVNISSLKKVLSVKKGAWYDANQIRDDLSSLQSNLLLQGMPFVNVVPEVQTDKAHHRVNLRFHIENGEPKYIQKIRILGNNVTKDYVIRRELTFVEGDAYNQSQIDESRRNLQNLGFFKSVDITQEKGDAPDKEIIDIHLKEDPTAAINLGGGYSTDAGVLANVGYSDKNFMGTGRSLSLQFKLGSYAKQANLNYFDPYFMGTDLSWGGGVFYNDNDYQRIASYNERQYGASTTMSYLLAPNISQSLSYSLSRDRIYKVAKDASDLIKKEKGVRVLSTFGQSIAYNTLDNYVWPSKGVKLSWGTQLTGVPFFPKVQTLSNIVSLTLYHPIYFSSLVGRVTLEGGYIQSLNSKEVALQDRFMLGGQTLRGFDIGGIGARDLKTLNSLGGTTYQRGSVQVRFPLGLPKEFGFYGVVFTDFGRLYGSKDRGTSIVQDNAWRQSVGVGMRWRTPMGFILKVDYAKPVKKKPYDITEEIQFNIVGSLGG